MNSWSLSLSPWVPGALRAQEYFIFSFLQVRPCQRRVLQEWRAKAVAKEAQLVARKEQKLEELRVYVEQRISAKKKRPKQVRNVFKSFF